MHTMAKCVEVTGQPGGVGPTLPPCGSQVIRLGAEPAHLSYTSYHTIASALLLQMQYYIIPQQAVCAPPLLYYPGCL